MRNKKKGIAGQARWNSEIGQIFNSNEVNYNGPNVYSEIEIIVSRWNWDVEARAREREIVR